MSNASNKPFFITTPVYYVNGKPHIGHAYTTIAADVVARFQKGSGREIFFSVGTDEHGAKIAAKAKESEKDPQVFVDEISEEFKKLWGKLHIQYSSFIRTTNPKHIAAVQKVLQTLSDTGAIYKGFYEGLYCVGCEQFKTADDLVDGKCPDHNSVPELMKEESYLMKMTELQPELTKKIKNDELAVRPERYKKEILSFLEGEKLEDISISRKNVSWGIPLPFDKTHTTYVWVDAFLNYLTVFGWDGDEKNVPKEWPADVQFIGKDILRVHATIWPVILMHLGIPVQKTLFTHGHILSGGKKMSKTLGNVIAIDDLLERFGVDGTRYLLLSAGPFGEDVDVTVERLTEKYNADLANGLGNLVSRVVKLASNLQSTTYRQQQGGEEYPEDLKKLLSGYKLSEALQYIWKKVAEANRYIDETKPWELVTTNQAEFETVMQKLLGDIAFIASWIEPFMPETAEKIKQALQERKTVPLFERI
ncbi:MAG: methionine--tRNA ligase [Candidatus Moranbacteria bacterium]|nr:methionine--tRNA ligase [Candidatus Moranbacteria bacterium]